MTEPSITRTFSLGQLTTLALHARLGIGEVVVECVDDLDEAVVTLTPRTAGSRAAADTTIALRGDLLSITAPKPAGMGGFLNRGRDRVDVTVVVPSATPLTLGSYAGSITVHGRCGSVDINTGSTTVTLDEVDGSLRLRCGDGTCWVESVRGSVAVRTGSGSVSVGEVDDSVVCTTGSGALEIGNARGSVRMRTGSGPAQVGSAQGDVDLTTGSGDIHIGIPSGVTARLDLNTGSGRVDSELDVSAVEPSGSDRSDRPSSSSSAPAGATSLRTIVRTSVRARTGSGDIRLVRAGSAS